MPIRFTMEESFPAPPERVFAVLTELDAAHEWMPNLVRIEKLTAGPFAVGTSWRETRRIFGKEASEQFDVTEHEPPRTLALYVDGRKGASGNVEYRFRYTLDPDPMGTRVRLDGEIDSKSFLGRLTGKLFVGMFRRTISKDFAAMRTHLARSS